MKEEIIDIIKKGADNLTISINVTVEQLINLFDNEELFTQISIYLDDTTIKRREWVICIRTLCQIDKVKANERFVQLLKSENPEKRYRLVQHLSGCGTQYIVPALVEILKEDPSPDIRCIVASALGDIGDSRALPALNWAAKNDHDANYENTLVSNQAQHSINLINNKM